MQPTPVKAGTFRDSSGSGIGAGTRTASINETFTVGQFVVIYGTINNNGTTFTGAGWRCTDAAGNVYSERIAPQVINASIGYQAAWTAQITSALTAAALNMLWTGSDNGNPYDLRANYAVFDDVDAAAAFVNAYKKAGSGSALVSDAFDVPDADSMVSTFLVSSGTSPFSAGDIGGAAATMFAASVYPANPGALEAQEYKAFAAPQSGITAAMNGGSFDQLAMMVVVFKGSSSGAPTPGFSIDQNLKSVELTDESVEGTNPITSVEYDYGDSSGRTASTLHQYAAGGTYTITQYVNDEVTAEQSTTHDVTTKSRFQHRVVSKKDGVRGAAAYVITDRPDA